MMDLSNGLFISIFNTRDSGLKVVLNMEEILKEWKARMATLVIPAWIDRY